MHGSSHPIRMNNTKLSIFSFENNIMFVFSKIRSNVRTNLMVIFINNRTMINKIVVLKSKHSIRILSLNKNIIFYIKRSLYILLLSTRGIIGLNVASNSNHLSVII